MTRLTLHCAVLATLAAAGCAYQPPQVSLRAVDVGESSDEALVLHLMLVLANPNDVAMPLEEFRYHVTIEGMPAFSGRRQAAATLEPQGDRVLSIPAVVPREAVGWTGAGAGSRITYSLTGSVSYATPDRLVEMLRDLGLPGPKAGFTAAGEIVLE